MVTPSELPCLLEASAKNPVNYKWNIYNKCNEKYLSGGLRKRKRENVSKNLFTLKKMCFIIVFDYHI